VTEGGDERDRGVLTTATALSALDPTLVNVAALEAALHHEMWRERMETYLEWASLASSLVIAISFLAGALYLAATGNTGGQVVGGLLGTVDLVALVAVFRHAS
jgi:hypothetical protein